MALPSLRDPPIAFAHRGGRAHAPENTIEAFTLALRLGATGLESDVWLTADGAPVLDHDGMIRAGLRRRPISSLERRQLPGHIPELAELYARCGTGFDLSLDVKDVAAAETTMAVAGEAGALSRTWLCHPDIDALTAWRDRQPDVRLVNSTTMRRLGMGPERRAAELGAARIDAVNFPHADWTGGLTTLFHRFERLAFGWGAQHEREIRALVNMGIDAVYSDWVDRLTAVIPTGPTSA